MSLYFDKFRRGVSHGLLRDIAGLPATDVGVMMTELVKEAVAVDLTSVADWVEQGAAEGSIPPEVVCSPLPFPETWAEWKYGQLSIAMLWVANPSADGQGTELIGMLFGAETGRGPVFFGSIKVYVDVNFRPVRCFMQCHPDAHENMAKAAGICLVGFQLLASPKEHVPRELVTPNAKERKRFRRRYGYEPANYYALDIGPTAHERTEKAHDDAESKRTGRTPRLHWVRGHFKRGSYVTPELPQGRYTRPFLRGSSESGIAITKSYNVLAPALPAVR